MFTVGSVSQHMEWHIWWHFIQRLSIQSVESRLTVGWQLSISQVAVDLSAVVQLTLNDTHITWLMYQSSVSQYIGQ